jgi:hypothetical protein
MRAGKGIIKGYPLFLKYNPGGRGIMDTTKLVVGQDVFMKSGCYGCSGRVVRVTPSGVDVQTPEMVGGLPSMDAKLIRFDNNGRSYATEARSSCAPEEHSKRPWKPDEDGTPEQGPWYISAYLVDGKMVFTEFWLAGS